MSSTSYPILDLFLTLLSIGFFVAAIAIPIWAIVDAIRRPSSSFVRAGSSKAMWLSLLIVFGVLAFFVSTVLGAVYLLRIRPRVQARMATAEAGWYADPGDPSQLRWWNGANWSSYVREGTNRDPDDSRLT